MQVRSIATVGAITLFCVALGVTAFAGTQSRAAAMHEPVDELPAFTALKTDAPLDDIESLQVVQKARRVGLATHLPPDLASTEKVLLDDLQAHLSSEKSWHREVSFTGETAQQLQETIDANPDTLVRIDVPELEVNQTIHLRNDTHIDGNGVRMNCTTTDPALRIEGVSNVSLLHIDLRGQTNIGVLVHNSSMVDITKCNFRDLAGKAIYIGGDSTYFHVAESTFSRCGQGGITAAGDASYGLIEANSIQDLLGYSNWMAGIVLTNLQTEDPANIWEPFPHDPPHFASRDTLADVPVSAHNIVVRGNQVSGNQSSGIYCDGVYSCFVFDNQVVNNDKEGMCLDYGALSCYVHDNEFAGNGRRINQSNEALELDGMLGYGKLDDGSAAAKLPGISLDNAAYNVIAHNQVHDNWGGGIKAVCCAVRNLISGNVINNNNLGENDVFYFTGVELGNAEAAEAPDMDHVGCFQNIIMGNQIMGNHYAGVFISHDSTGNLITENTIEDQKRFAIMSGSKLSNDISGNEYSGFVVDRSFLPV